MKKTKVQAMRKETKLKVEVVEIPIFDKQFPGVPIGRELVVTLSISGKDLPVSFFCSVERTDREYVAYYLKIIANVMEVHRKFIKPTPGKHFMINVEQDEWYRLSKEIGDCHSDEDFPVGFICPSETTDRESVAYYLKVIANAIEVTRKNIKPASGELNGTIVEHAEWCCLSKAIGDCNCIPEIWENCRF